MKCHKLPFAIGECGKSGSVHHHVPFIPNHSIPPLFSSCYLLSSLIHSTHFFLLFFILFSQMMMMPLAGLVCLLMITAKIGSLLVLVRQAESQVSSSSKISSFFTKLVYKPIFVSSSTTLLYYRLQLFKGKTSPVIIIPPCIPPYYTIQKSHDHVMFKSMKMKGKRN